MRGLGHLAILALLLSACGGKSSASPASAASPSDAGTPGGADGGWVSDDPTAPMAAVADDPATCAQPILPHPDLTPEPDRPCTEEASPFQTTFRYDGSGRVIYRSFRYSTYEETYRSEDEENTRVETWTSNGAVEWRLVTQLKNGLPVQGDQSGTSRGPLELAGHFTWNYDQSGRQTSMISQSGSWATVERDYYDSAGRLYLTFWTGSLPGATAGLDSYLFRSWFANGSRAHQDQCIGLVACNRIEKRWDACGNVIYDGYTRSNGRWSGWVDWSWDKNGLPLRRHDRWTEASSEWNSTEVYTLDTAGRVISGHVVTAPPPAPHQPRPDQDVTYQYDSGGRVIERIVAGQSTFHARYDEAGRLIERAFGPSLTRWTYDGCGR